MNSVKAELGGGGGAGTPTHRTHTDPYYALILEIVSWR